MAVTAILNNSRLSLTFNDGVDMMTGKDLFKTKSFNNVKTDATADQLYAVVQAFIPLQQRTIYRVEREDNSTIKNL